MNNMSEMVNRLYDQQEEKIDIIHSLVKGWKMFKKTWWLLFILAAVGIAGAFGYMKLYYTPEYEASASFTVNVGSNYSDYSSYISISQLSATFPYILESGALTKVVCEDLGVSSLPGTITASVIEETNLFQICVRSEDSQMAYDILESVINNYPKVAKFIIGNTTMTMLDNTGVPTVPVNPLNVKKSMVYGAAVAAGLYLLILMILTAARKTVSGEDDLRKYVSVRCLANIPKTYMKRRSGKKKQLMLVDHKVTPAFVEAVNALRIRTVRQLRMDNSQVVLVTSTSESEGKTTVAANLALSCAMKGYKVLIIDGDMRHPSVGQMFGLQQEVGLEQVIKGELKLEEAADRYEKTHLCVLAGSKSAAGDKISALLGSEGMNKLIEKCKQEFDYIFIDTPPCGMMQDAATLTPVSDCVLMVVRQDYVARDRILSAMELMADTGVRLLGYVINSEETGIGSYGYGRYGYGKYGYGKYGKYGKYGYGNKSGEEADAKSEKSDKDISQDSGQ